MPCNRVYELLQEVCRSFYRKFRSSTGCSVILLQDVSKWDFGAWMIDGRCMDGYGGRMGV